MTTWSKMQEKAIYTKNKNILVSASAGSGKTTVLIARLLNLIQQERIEINQILAMTFTEAAASEMKKRLSIALNKALEESKTVEEKEFLQKQLANVSSAYISTIHGFCLTLIQNYYYVIGLSKERISNIMDDATSSSLLDKSMKMTFHHFMAKEDFISLCMLFSSKANSDENLKQAILDLFHLASAKSEPFTFLESCKIQHKITSFKDYPCDVLAYFFDYLQVQCDTIYQACQEYDIYLKEEEEDKKRVTLQNKMEALMTCQNALSTQDYTTFKSGFIVSSASSIPTIKDHEEAKKVKKQIESIEEGLHSILFEEKQYIDFSNENIPYINTLVDVVCYFLTTYNRLKEDLQCIDFSDMEHFALQILKAEGGIVSKIYKEQFKEIMVDEFQDSNDVQDDLVKLICKENNVFRVGDIKQSIYGFRHATPEIMRSLIQNKTEQDEIIYLSSNYRSKKSIVDFNNHLFTSLMNVKGFSSSFSDNDNTNCGLEEQAKDCIPVQFHILNEAEFKPFRKEYNISSDALKAEYIAQQIVKKVKTEGYRFKDFVVLIKTNAKAEYLRDAFEKVNIPYFISMKQGFYESSAVSSVLSFLKALHTPNEDLHFVSFLLSSFMNISNEELANVKLKKKGSYFQYYKKLPVLNEFNTLLLHKNKIKVSELLTKIYCFNNYYEDFTSAQEKSNLDKLYDIACSYEQKSYLTLPQFLNIVEQSKDAKIGEAIPIGNEENVVRVMSIHQSKGLQFPVVFLYSISNVSIMDTKGIVTYDDTLKIGLNHVDLTYRYTCLSMERIALNHKISKAALEEEMRLLYVATTRAQKEMHLVDFALKEDRNSLDRVEIYKKKGFTAWILQAMAHIHNTYPYYRETYVDSYWNLEALPSTSSSYTEKMCYTQNYKEITTHSPSENEIVSYRPRKFSLFEDYAMKRGTKLHKMVEILPNTVWDEEILDLKASLYNLHLSKHDKEILLSLNKHPLFVESFQGEVIHEFPFMIKEEETITHGYMDYISIFEEKVIMIDFKSDRNIDKETLVHRYQGQIEAYSHALSYLYPNKKIQSYIYSFELKEMIQM